MLRTAVRTLLSACPPLCAGLALVLASGCLPPLPTVPSQRALVRDVARVVDVRSRVGWVIDHSEVEAAMPYVLKSACQVSDSDRQQAIAFLDDAIEAAGGDPAKVWRERDKDIDAVEDLMLLARTRLALVRADEWVRLGRCPFWLEPTPRFAGVQTQGSRWVLTLEGGGRVTASYVLGLARYGGGGSGRLLVGYALGETVMLSLGPELGGDATFTNLELGQVSELPELVAFSALPVVLRWYFGLSVHLEIEAGPLAYFNEGSADATTGRVNARYYGGVRGGIAVGGTYLRLGRGVLPKFSVALTVEHIPAVDKTPTLTQIGIGVRTGIDLSRWARF